MDKIFENGFPKLSGYIDEASYYPNDNINIRAHTIDEKDIINIDIISRKRQLLINYKNIIVYKQKYKEYSFAEGCNWDICFNFIIPSNFISDIYFIKLYNEKYEFFIPLIIKTINKYIILVLANNFTWNAYNNWAGIDGKVSAYMYNCKLDKYKTNNNHSYFLSFHRPFCKEYYYIILFMYNDIYNTPFQRHTLYLELLLYEYLDKLNITFDLITDVDMDLGYNINSYSVFIIQGHPEYWTKNQLIGLHPWKFKMGQLIIPF